MSGDKKATMLSFLSAREKKVILHHGRARHRRVCRRSRQICAPEENAKG
jgi:hypothetical protein